MWIHEISKIPLNHLNASKATTDVVFTKSSVPRLFLVLFMVNLLEIEEIATHPAPTADHTTYIFT